MTKDEIISGLQITCDELAYNIVSERELHEELKTKTEIDRIYFDVLENVDIDIFSLKSYFNKGGFINPFSDNFLIFIHDNISSLKRKLKWIELVDLSYRFDIIEINYNISTKFKKSFLEYSKKITLKQLFEIPINTSFYEKDEEPFLRC